MRRKLITALFLAGLVTTTWAVLGADAGGTVHVPAQITVALPP